MVISVAAHQYLRVVDSRMISYHINACEEFARQMEFILWQLKIVCEMLIGARYPITTMLASG